MMKQFLILLSVLIVLGSVWYVSDYVKSDYDIRTDQLTISSDVNKARELLEDSDKNRQDSNGGDPSRLGTNETATVTEEGTWQRVESITDGDTVRVYFGSSVERVRLIGIDTPETVKSGAPVECYGLEASDRISELVKPGDSVRLVQDSSQGDRDLYGRPLRYILLKDGTDVGLEMLRGGYARESTYGTTSTYRLQQSYRNAQNIAQSSTVGLWKDCRA